MMAKLVAHWREPLYQNTYFLIATTLVNTGSGFVFWIFAARLVSPDSLGLATTVVSVITLLSLLAKAGLDIGVLQLAGAPDARLRHRAITSAFVTATTLSVAGAAVFVAGIPVWAPRLHFLGGTASFILLAALVATWTASFISDSVFVAHRAAHFVLLKTIAHAVVKVLLVIMLAPTLDVHGIVLASHASMLCVLFLVALWLRQVEHGFRPVIENPLHFLRAASRDLVSNYVVSLVMFLPLTIGSLVVLERAGATMAGSYYILWMFGTMALMAPAAFGQSALVEMLHTNNLRVLLRPRPLLLTIGMAAIVVVVGFFLLPLFGGSYADVRLRQLIPFALSAIPGFALHAQMARARATGDVRSLLVGPITTVAVYMIAIALLPLSLGLIAWAWFSAITLGGGAAILLARGATSDSSELEVSTQ